MTDLHPLCTLRHLVYHLRAVESLSVLNDHRSLGTRRRLIRYSSEAGKVIQPISTRSPTGFTTHQLSCVKPIHDSMLTRFLPPLKAPCKEDIQIFLMKNAVAGARPRLIRISYGNIKVSQQLGKLCQHAVVIPR